MPYYKYEDKNIYYEEYGDGKPLIFLHGNSVSSKMFFNVLDLYKNDYKVILIDFLGHGRSDRLKKFPVDLWYNEALQVIKFLEIKQLGKVNLIGTSGGALVALNIALECPYLVNRLVADSFEGEKSLKNSKNIIKDRALSKSIQEVREFWKFNHGEDWESIVDNDSEAILQHYLKVHSFFHKDLTELNIPVLLTGSLEDEFAPEIDKIYESLLSKITYGSKYIFKKGSHPSMISNAKEFSEKTKAFFNQ